LGNNFPFKLTFYFFNFTFSILLFKFYFYPRMNQADLKLSRQTGALLREKGATLGLAESCTGGYLSHLVTATPGSSAYFLGSVVCYDNMVKSGLLGVKNGTLKKHGAVSAECAAELVKGARKNLGCDYALATTGIAGPAGAVKGKPVGTVYIALAANGQVLVRRFRFEGNRLSVMHQSARKALEMLQEALL
jgi:PncC family amidohydrolase